MYQVSIGTYNLSNGWSFELFSLHSLSEIHHSWVVSLSVHFFKLFSSLRTMNEQCLLAINNYGKIFTLSTFGDQWKLFPHASMDLKHISAVDNYIWSIGGDNQTYLLVHNLWETIRIKEEVYENEVNAVTCLEIWCRGYI